MVVLFWGGRRRLLSCRGVDFMQYWIQELYFASYLREMFFGKHTVTYPAAWRPVQRCDTCVGKKAFPLGGVHSGPTEIDGFQNHPGHSSLSAQTFNVWKEEYASMTNVHPLLCKTSSHRAFVSAVALRCLDSILQWLENHNGFLGMLWIPIKILRISHQ